MLQCLSYQFPCALQLKQWGILKDVKCHLCEKYYRERNIPEPPDSVESVGHIHAIAQLCNQRNLTHIYVSKTRAHNILTVSTGHQH